MKGSPKLVIYAYEECMHDFFYLFGDSRTDHWDSEPVEGRKLYWKKADSGKAIAAVFPIYGQYPKDEQISSAGLRIRALCDAQLGSDWLPKSLQP